VYVTVLVSLLAVLQGVFRLCRYYLPHDGYACALYDRYKDSSGINATFIKDFQFNDTLAVDAILLQATTDSAWRALLLDFGMPKDFLDDYFSNPEAFVGSSLSSLLFFHISKSSSPQRVSPKNDDSWPVIGSFTEKNLCVFMADKKNIKEIVTLTNIKKLNK